MGNNKTTTKAISLAHLNTIRQYIDKEIRKKTDGIMTGYEDVKCIGLQESTAYSPIDIFDCGSCDIYSYNHTKGVDTIINKPKSLKGPFVLIRSRETITDDVIAANSNIEDKLKAYKGKQLVRTFIFTTDDNTALLPDSDPLVYSNKSIFYQDSGKGYAVDGITADKWDVKTLTDLTVNTMIKNGDDIYLSEQYDLSTGLAIKSLNNDIDKIKDLPKGETVNKIASVIIRSTSIGEVELVKNDVKYIVQELSITHNDAAQTKKSYLRFLSKHECKSGCANPCNITFDVGYWNEKTLLDFKEISALAMINAFNDSIDNRFESMKAYTDEACDGLKDEISKLDSSALEQRVEDIETTLGGQGGGSNLVSKFDSIEDRLDSLGFKKGCIVYEKRDENGKITFSEIVGYIARLGKMCYMRFIRNSVALTDARGKHIDLDELNENGLSLKIYELDGVIYSYAFAGVTGGSASSPKISCKLTTKHRLNNMDDFIKAYNIGEVNITDISDGTNEYKEFDNEEQIYVYYDLVHTNIWNITKNNDNTFTIKYDTIWYNNSYGTKHIGKTITFSVYDITAFNVENPTHSGIDFIVPGPTNTVSRTTRGHSEWLDANVDTKLELASKEINTRSSILVENISTIVKVDEVPSTRINTRAMYLVPNEKGNFDERLFVDGEWITIGTTAENFVNFTQMKVKMVVVDSLPERSELPTKNINPNTMYLIPNNDGSYDEYVCDNNTWVCVGNATVPDAFKDYGKNINKIDTLNSYNDLPAKAQLPTNNISDTLIYLLGKVGGKYEEYVYDGNTWVCINDDVAQALIENYKDIKNIDDNVDKYDNLPKGYVLPNIDELDSYDRINSIYFLHKNDDTYDQYMVENNDWVKIGNASTAFAPYIGRTLDYNKLNSYDELSDGAKLPETKDVNVLYMIPMMDKKTVGLYKYNIPSGGGNPVLSYYTTTTVDNIDVLKKVNSASIFNDPSRLLPSGYILPDADNVNCKDTLYIAPGLKGIYDEYIYVHDIINPNDKGEWTTIGSADPILVNKASDIIKTDVVNTYDDLPDKCILPTDNISTNTLYLMRKIGGTCDIQIYKDNAWEIISTTNDINVDGIKNMKHVVKIPDINHLPKEGTSLPADVTSTTLYLLPNDGNTKYGQYVMGHKGRWEFVGDATPYIDAINAPHRKIEIDSISDLPKAVTLPKTGVDKTLYLISDVDNTYGLYLYVNNSWKSIGSVSRNMGSYINHFNAATHTTKPSAEVSYSIPPIGSSMTTLYLVPNNGRTRYTAYVYTGSEWLKETDAIDAQYLQYVVGPNEDGVDGINAVKMLDTYLNSMYLIKELDASGNNYEEYIYHNGKWTLFGTISDSGYIRPVANTTETVMLDNKDSTMLCLVPNSASGYNDLYVYTNDTWTLIADEMNSTIATTVLDMKSAVVPYNNTFEKILYITRDANDEYLYYNNAWNKVGSIIDPIHAESAIGKTNVTVITDNDTDKLYITPIFKGSDTYNTLVYDNDTWINISTIGEDKTNYLTNITKTEIPIVRDIIDTLYLVPNTNGTYDEYFYINNVWTVVGNTDKPDDMSLKRKTSLASNKITTLYLIDKKDGTYDRYIYDYNFNKWELLDDIDSNLANNIKKITGIVEASEELKTLYLIPNADGTYDQYIYDRVNLTWNEVGTANSNFNNYVTKIHDVNEIDSSTTTIYIVSNANGNYDEKIYNTDPKVKEWITVGNMNENVVLNRLTVKISSITELGPIGNYVFKDLDEMVFYSFDDRFNIENYWPFNL